MAESGMRAWLARRRNRWPAAVAAALLVLGSGGLLGAHALGLDDLPAAGAVMSTGLPDDNLVFDRTGTVLLAELQQPVVQHDDVPLQAMGRWLPMATVAIDDPGFWSEPGVDPGGLLQAAWTDLRAGALVRTGSTITQRLVRLRLGGDSSTAGRLRQAALALRVAGAYPRDRILEAYLNSLPYGNRAIGVEAAAITYFQVDASQLDLAQAALLAGLPAAPSLLDPLKHLPAAKQRQLQVLDAMVRGHAVTRQQADQAAAETLLLIGPATLDVVPGFVELVQAELTRRFGAAAVRRGGLTVLTTLDWGLQQQAELAMRDAVAANRWRGADQGAMVAMDPHTGDLLAFVGSASPNAPGGQYDFAAGLPRSPGSAMATFAYAAAIASRRYTMVTPLADAPLSIELGQGEPNYAPRNFDLRFHGTCALAACLGSSLNVPAIEVEMGLGVPEVVRTARALGAPPLVAHVQIDDGSVHYTTDDPPDRFGPPLVLGGYGETPLSLATAGSTLAAGGVLRQPRTVLRVAAPDGGAVFQVRASTGTPALNPGAAFVVSQMLADDANRALVYGVGGPMVLPGRHAAAGAGTSEEFRDAWTVGYTPSLAAAVWIGNASYAPMRPGSDGALVAAPAWHRFMQAALDQLQKGDEWYGPPADVEAATVDGRPVWFLPGTSAATPAPPLPADVHVGG
jgi:membrane peptidoglycan carboxypeptidase